MTEPSGSPASPLPSSTVLVLRDAPHGAGPFQVLMVKRHGSVTFPGVHAFPGGVVDPGDARAPVATLPADQRWAEGGGGDTEATALPYWVAAVRELFEEVGILLAMRGGRLLEGPLPRDLAASRERLHGGERLAAVLERAGVVPGTHLLYAFARWVTPSVNRRRFDTRFLVTRGPAGQDPVADGTETESCAWYAPDEALAAYLRGEIELIPPTVRTLDDLSRFTSAGAVLAHARTRAVLPYCPEIAHEDGRVVMTYPGSPADPPLVARRLALEQGRWRPLPD